MTDLVIDDKIRKEARTLRVREFNESQFGRERSTRNEALYFLTLAQEIQRFIPSASFPPKLGFIELPYSQGPSFFTNLVIYHEIGHVVYEQLSTPHGRNRYFKTLRSAQDRSLAE